MSKKVILLFVCVFILVIFIFATKENVRKYMLFEIDSTDTNLKNITENSRMGVERTVFHQPTYADNILNLSNFNFNGECREPFKYEPHSEKDLVFVGIYYPNKKRFNSHKRMIEYTARLMNSSIPHAKKVCVVYQNDEQQITFLRKCGYDVIFAKRSALNNSTINAAIDRFVQLSYYLKEHKGEYNRVALMDTRDVFWFADGFQTISPEEVIFTEECVSLVDGKPNCIDYTQNVNYNWLRQTYGLETANEYRKAKKHIINVGTIIGGIKPFSELLNVFIKEINRKSDVLHIWGIDNAMIGYLYYSGGFNGINVTLNSYSQRLAFTCCGGFDYDASKKTITIPQSGCSPVVRHKVDGNNLLKL